MNRVNVLKWVLTSFGTLCQSSPINPIKSFDEGAVTIYRRSKKSIPKNNNYFALEPRNTLADDDILHRGLLTEEEEETAPSDDHVLRSNITRYKDDDGNLINQNEAFDANDNDNQSNIFSIMDEEEDEENAYNKATPKAFEALQAGLWPVTPTVTNMSTDKMEIEQEMFIEILQESGKFSETPNFSQITSAIPNITSSITNDNQSMQEIEITEPKQAGPKLISTDSHGAITIPEIDGTNQETEKQIDSHETPEAAGGASRLF
ncbi:8111_t:CDS:2, partial [Gigaspora rosea]